MAKRPAKNITSLPNQTMVPTATLLGLFTTGVVTVGVNEVLVTVPLWPISVQLFLILACQSNDRRCFARDFGDYTGAP